MPRTARLLVDLGFYHIVTRGNNRQTVFHHSNDYEAYLHILGEAKREHGIDLYHFALMPNHVHLIVRPARAVGLRKGMQRVNQSYANHYRRCYGYVGHLWQGRFRSFLIDRESYLLQCGKYIEMNPVRAGLVRHPSDYRWSSYRVYAYSEASSVVDLNPLYLAISHDPSVRSLRYRRLVEMGTVPFSKRVRSKKKGTVPV